MKISEMHYNNYWCR